MQKYFIKYQEHNAVGIRTHVLNGSSWTQSLFDVGDLVAAFFPNTAPNELGQYTLHLPEGVDISSLSADCFADSGKTTLDIGCPLSALGSLGSKSKQPLTIRSINDTPRFIRSQSDEKFVNEYSLDLSKQNDSRQYVKYLIKKYYINRLSDSLSTSFADNCLEYQLGTRTTKYIPDPSDNVKLLLAVSGAGKTRMLLELLYENFGYYFTIKSSTAKFGSKDLSSCHKYCDIKPEECERAIRLLYFVRVEVCKYLRNSRFHKPWHILLAQLHPDEFFGVDIFEKIFTVLLKEPILNTELSDMFEFVAIDEIQVSTGSPNVHKLQENSSLRPFFSPLVLFSKSLGCFTKFLLSGTGIDFELVKELMESSTMKNNQQTNYEVFSPFHALNKTDIKKYCILFLEKHQVQGVELKNVVTIISSFELCHGRPRFVAFILDNYMESKNIEVAIGLFISGISDVHAQIFPLRFLKDDIQNGIFTLEKRSRSLDRVIFEDTLGSLIRDGLIDFILKGKLIIRVNDNDGVDAIRYGLGFGLVSGKMIREIKIQEQAVVECLRYFVPFASIVKTFAMKIAECPKPQMVGYLLEYLVSFALVAKYSGENAANNITAYQDPPHLYLQHGTESQVCFPDHMCGPDIIYKCKSKNTIYFVQVKFLKGISKQEAVKACDTVNKELFYCKRNDKNGSKNTVLKGFEEKRNLLLESIDELQKDGYSLQPILFVHSEKPMSSNMREAMIVTRNSNPDFFNSLGCEASGIWNLLDSARSNF